MLKSGGGAIVNCASVGGLVAYDGLGAYIASKHGVVGLTKTAAVEYIRQGIRINAVCPAMVDTPMANNALSPEAAAIYKAASPIGRFATPEEIAAAALWLCEAEARFITGQAIAVDGGWTAR
jgi:NAD(P)-dependent dehydrogenase (short-subunit alcohol dehydrogenase family)